MKRPIILSAVLAANLAFAGLAFAQAGGAGGGVGPGPGGALGGTSGAEWTACHRPARQPRHRLGLSSGEPGTTAASQPKRNRYDGGTSGTGTGGSTGGLVA